MFSTICKGSYSLYTKQSSSCICCALRCYHCHVHMRTNPSASIEHLQGHFIRVVMMVYMKLQSLIFVLWDSAQQYRALMMILQSHDTKRDSNMPTLVNVCCSSETSTNLVCCAFSAIPFFLIHRIFHLIIIPLLPVEEAEVNYCSTYILHSLYKDRVW